MKKELILTIAVLAVSASGAEAQAVRVRCFLSGATAQQREQAWPKITHPVGITHFVETEAAVLTRLFNVFPRLYHFSGPDSYNAFASDWTEPGIGKGTVYFGSDLMGKTLADQTRSWASVGGILGHEFAHIAQFERGEPADALESELHADYLAGFYLSRRGLQLPGGAERFTYTLFSFGDTDFDFYDPVGHGTGDQRVAAMLAGYYAGEFDRRLSFQNAFDRGLRRVRELIPTFRDLSSGISEISPRAHNPDAFATVRAVRASYNWEIDVRNPLAHFNYAYRNGGDQPLVIKLVVNSLVVPVNGEGEPGEPRILTQRRLQHRVEPGGTVEFVGQIRSTSQSGIVRVRLEPELVVAFEKDLATPPQ